MRKKKCTSPSVQFSSDSGFDYNPESLTDDLVPGQEEVVVTLSAITKAFKSRKDKLSEEPLPDPFPLPENYRPDVQLALETGKMTGETRRTYLSQVASAIFNCKKYPTRDEFTRVAIDIVNRYPFLGSPSSCGSKTVLS